VTFISGVTAISSGLVIVGKVTFSKELGANTKIIIKCTKDLEASNNKLVNHDG
jgi:hypothetical protein